jgi:hypothetical protein
MASLPKAIAGGFKRQERRQAGSLAPALTPSGIIRGQVPIRPVMPPPPGSPAALAVSKLPAALAPGRLTAVRAIQAQRDKGRARAVEAGPLEARRAWGREIRSAKNASVAASTILTRRNPASPQADLTTGRKRYSSAFSSSRFSAPFQKSNNSRRAYGA